MAKIPRYEIWAEDFGGPHLKLNIESTGEWVRWEELEPILKELKDRSRVLAALEAAGVDNWEGYEEAFSDSGE